MLSLTHDTVSERSERTPWSPHPRTITPPELIKVRRDLKLMKGDS
jgi:hypothetical protein